MCQARTWLVMHEVKCPCPRPKWFNRRSEFLFSFFGGMGPVLESMWPSPRILPLCHSEWRAVSDLGGSFHTLIFRCFVLIPSLCLLSAFFSHYAKYWYGAKISHSFHPWFCHVKREVLQLLDREFEGRVVSRNAIRGHEWPPRSPDLNPLDFFLWGFLKWALHFD